MTNSNILTTRQAAEYLGVSKSTIYRMVEEGILSPSKTPGGQRRFTTEELEEYKKKSVNIVAPQKRHSETTKQEHIEYSVDLISGQLTFEIPEVETGESKLIKVDRKSNTNGTNNVVIEETIEEEKTERKEPDKRNKLNDLNGSEWLPETKSFFYQKGLGAKHPHAQIERQHPAPYSFQDIQHLISFFTKKGMHVLDPFGGVGSTAKACEIEGRYCTSIELSPKWHELSIKRLETEVGEGTAQKHTFINGDCIKELKKIGDSSMDFMVTSPPYWSILNKKADYKVKATRLKDNLATNYSNDPADLANVKEYGEFLKILVEDVFMECARIIKPQKYMCIVVSDFRNKNEFVSFHSDLIQALNKKKTSDGYKVGLQGVKVLLQNHIYNIAIHS